VRVMHEGMPVEALKWTPLSDFIGMLEAQVPPNIAQACMDG
jgi:hypothetical protein